ncbi:uncharacterized protein LOC143564987 [Bidens hawaiensis]|uniref:uncharacterized protein LOC143564987 n=1 Tax=Bidens hawaiensis TaxID=980011 RepID=UPI00404B5975
MADNEFIMTTPQFFTHQTVVRVSISPAVVAKNGDGGDGDGGDGGDGDGGDGGKGVFGSHEELMNWVQNLARSLGVVVVTKRSNKYPNGFVYKVVIMCDRGGKYKVKDSSKVSGTKKTDCPFELEGKYSIEYNSWTLTMICDEHNHPPVQHMEGHPYAKRLTDDEFSLVAELTRMNVAPRDILSILKERNLSNASTISTIYNARTKIRMSEQAGNSPMQVLMSILHSNGYVYEFTTTGSNELENLFFVHPISFDIWRAFPHVLIIDATYKTNSYNMPFVQIVGVTSTNKTFSIAFAFMQNEKIESYTWVLNCLKLTLDKCMHPRVILTDRELALVNACKEVFPNATQLLCRWHISRNIFKNCRQSIRSARDWDNFLKLWELLEDSTTLVSYTDNYKQLQSFLIKYPPLDIILADHESWKNLQVDSSNCGCRLRNSCGLPCAYELSMYISSGQCISLDSIDIFWRKLDFVPSTTVQDDDVSCENELKHFKENFNKQFKAGKKSWLRKLKDIIGLGTTDIQEPQIQKNTRGRPNLKKSQQKRRVGQGTTDIQEPRVQKNTRGRPSLKKSQQKRRAEYCSARYSCSNVPNFVDPIKEPARHSSFEFDLNSEPLIDLNEVPGECFERSYMIDLNVMPQLNDSNIMSDIPKVFHPYITNIQNVKCDGNCGFRAIAVCLGLDEEKSYEYIRQQMREELQNRYDIYKDMFVRDVNSLYHDLCFFGSPCPEEHWMKMPESGPEESQHHRALTIALVFGETHYVMVELQGESPMPVITPYWNLNNISRSAVRWETMYKSRLELYSQLYRPESGFVDLSD